jgi:nucleotide-binding universal stress UspA family protein
MITNEFSNSTLVPIDFSETSLIALEHAAAIADIMNETPNLVTLLHVIEGASFNPVSGHTNRGENDKDTLAIEGAIHRLEKIIGQYADRTNVTYKYIVAGGKPYRRIAELAEEVKADTIVMGTHGSSGIQAFAGSNASRVIQIAPCPVVVIKEKAFGRGYKNIVLPLDLTKETKQKVNAAVKIAGHYDSTIHILTMAESDEFLANKLHNNLAQVKEYLEERNIKCSTTVLDASGGNFARQTIVWAQGRDADLIVIMAQQEKGLTEYIFGSYAQQIVNRSPIPVMAITPNPKLVGIIENTVGTGIYSH